MSNEPDEVNYGALATIIVIVAIATLGIALVVTSFVREETQTLQAQKGGTQENEYRDLKAAQLAEITAAPIWRDREKGVVSVPIDRAMEMVAEAVRENPFNLSPGSPKAEEDEALTDEAELELEPGSELEAAPEGGPGGEPTAREKAMVEDKSPVEEDPKTKGPPQAVPVAPKKAAPAGPATEKSAPAPEKSAPAPAKPAPAPQKPPPTTP